MGEEVRQQRKGVRGERVGDKMRGNEAEKEVREREEHRGGMKKGRC